MKIVEDRADLHDAGGGRKYLKLRVHQHPEGRLSRRQQGSTQCDRPQGDSAMRSQQPARCESPGGGA
jgi:hypothetical protein